MKQNAEQADLDIVEFNNMMDIMKELADTLGINNDDLKKIFSNGSIKFIAIPNLFASNGANIIDKNLIDKSIDTDFIICSLAPTIAAGLKANGINVEVKDDDVCTMLPNAFIFAYKDRAWMIWNDLSVSELEEYFAIGSGSDVAKGALFATKKQNPFERIVTAIDAASESTLFVDDGIDLLVTGEHDGDGSKIAKALGFEIEEDKEELKKAEAKAKKMKKK